jgi:hypothetical protein
LAPWTPLPPAQFLMLLLLQYQHYTRLVCPNILLFNCHVSDIKGHQALLHEVFHLPTASACPQKVTARFCRVSGLEWQRGWPGGAHCCLVLWHQHSNQEPTSQGHSATIRLLG